MTTDEWTRDVDIQIPSPARMYDYWLGGSHNFAADRAAAEQVLTVLPNARQIAVANRRFLTNAVRHLSDAGVRQFLDIGSGIPTVGNVHELIQGTDTPSRVVYVDTDPVAVAHSTELLRDIEHATAIRADLRAPDAILNHRAVRDTLDFTEPIALLMVSMLHFVPDEDAYPAVARLRAAVAPGSYLALTHVVPNAMTAGSPTAVVEIYRRSTTPTSALRDRAAIESFFGDFQPIPPGLVWLTQWDPQSEMIEPSPADPDGLAVLAGVARKSPATD